MRKFVSTLVSTALLTSSIAVSAPVFARNASTLTDINGARGSSAENMLEQRGFTYITGNKNSMGYVYSYWWNAADKNCVQVEVHDGLVSTINDAKDSDCNHSNGNTAAAVGAVAGLAILGAALASKSHHHKGKEYNQEQTGEFDRGYKDGLYNASYHNYNRSDAYSDGYAAGVDERNANLSHHHNRGGYVPAVNFSDLRGADAVWAIDQMRDRGFDGVDSFSSGNTLYGIYYNRRTRQCVQMTNADSRVYDIRDIQTGTVKATAPVGSKAASRVGQGNATPSQTR